MNIEYDTELCRAVSGPNKGKVMAEMLVWEPTSTTEYCCDTMHQMISEGRVRFVSYYRKLACEARVHVLMDYCPSCGAKIVYKASSIIFDDPLEVGRLTS